MSRPLPSAILILALSLLAPLLPAMVGGGGGGGGVGGGRSASNGSPLLYAPEWTPAATAFDAGLNPPPGVVVVFVAQPDTSGLWTDRLLADADFKRLRHVRIERGGGSPLLARLNIEAYPTLVFCDAWGNPIHTLVRPDRAAVRLAYRDFPARRQAFQADLDRAFATARDRQDAAALQRIAALAGPVADAARRLLAPPAEPGKLAAP